YCRAPPRTRRNSESRHSPVALLVPSLFLLSLVVRAHAGCNDSTGLRRIHSNRDVHCHPGFLIGNGRSLSVYCDLCELSDDKRSRCFFFGYRDGVSGYTGNYRWLILRRRACLLFLTSGKRG